MSTKIEWTDVTWSPVTGCTKVSEGCAHCYAERMSRRLKGRFGYPEDEPFRVTLHPDRLDQPLKWKKPRHIFVCSMGDLFHPDCFQNYIINDIYLTMAQAKQHTFLILTKRPDNMFEWFHKYTRKEDPPIPNLWLGITAENQQRADERIPILLQIPAAKRFVSIEPMLGPVDLTDITINEYQSMDALKGNTLGIPPKISVINHHQNKLDWVICGGESGPGARPMHPDWVRSIRDQCVAAGVPWFFKQWGEVNKKKTWRLLDGIIWNEMPDYGNQNNPST